jgi:hypothetical protein
MSTLSLEIADATREKFVSDVKDYKRKLAIEDAQRLAEELRPSGDVPAVPFEIDESLFIKDCTADLDSPCDCPACEKYERESMADALASYVPKKSVDDECDEPCNDPHCVTCHQDCELNECQVCLEKAMDDAEWAVDAARDREMGI